MQNKNLLIFPSCMPRSIEYANNAKIEGFNVIGSSSIEDDSSKKNYSDWVYLPLVGSHKFLEELVDTITKYSISLIYTPNGVVWEYLNSKLNELPNNVKLANSSPIAKELYPFRQADNFYNEYITSSSFYQAGLEKHAKLTKFQIKSIFKHSESIPGMCDHQKLLALLDIARSSSKGDIIEIGSWWGKSAFVLSQLATYYDIGNVLCVDPWDDRELTQSTAIVDIASQQVSASEAFDVFITNLLAYKTQNINYLKMKSVEGSAYYSGSTDVISNEFGKIKYCGQISILHIDGNHSYENVKADIETWQNYLTDNAWVVFDDYEWAYGNGPKLVGDDFLAKNKNRINCSFIKGGALFVNIANTK